MTMLEYRHVDVFADAPLAGNGLAVIVTEDPLAADLMQRLTCELRQFETIFLSPTEQPEAYEARVFTMEEEVPFAGHPSLGAAAVLHERVGGDVFACRLVLPAGVVELASRREATGYRVTMNQGRPEFGTVIAAEEEGDWLEAMGLSAQERDRSMPLCVASTGLPYLVIPVTKAGLERARIGVDDFEQRLSTIGARFVYVLDLEGREGRTWDNAGLVEDIATGSAAGPVTGLLVKHGFAVAGEPIVIRQGRFVGRPSEMLVEVQGGPDRVDEVLLSGSVQMIARGRFDELVTA